MRSTLEGGLGFSVVKDDISTMIIGTESGKVLKANLPDMNTTKIPTDRIRWRTDAMLLLCNSSQAGKHHVRNIAEKYAVDTGRKEVDAACIFASKPDIVKLYPNSVSFVYER